MFLFFSADAVVVTAVVVVVVVVAVYVYTGLQSLTRIINIAGFMLAMKTFYVQWFFSFFKFSDDFFSLIHKTLLCAMQMFLQVFSQSESKL